MLNKMFSDLISTQPQQAGRRTYNAPVYLSNVPYMSNFQFSTELQFSEVQLN